MATRLDELREINNRLMQLCRDLAKQFPTPPSATVFSKGKVHIDEAWRLWQRARTLFNSAIKEAEDS